MKKVSKAAWIIAAGLAAPLNAQAFELAYQPWYVAIDGEVLNRGPAISLRDELNITHASSHGFSVAEEGWLRLSYTPIDVAETGTVVTETTFGGSTYTTGTNLRTNADLTDMAAQFMWRPFSDADMAQGLAIGATIKVVDAVVDVTNLDAPEEGGGLPILGGGNPSPTERETISEVFPMLSLRYRGPLYGLLHMDAEASYITYEDDEVLELQLAMEVRGDSVGFILGWHQKNYDISTDSFGLDAQFKGMFARVSLYL